MRHGGGHAAFGHDRMCLAQQRLADQSDGHARVRGLDGRAQAGAAGANDEDVVGIGGVSRHYWWISSNDFTGRSDGAARRIAVSTSLSSQLPMLMLTTRGS